MATTPPSEVRAALTVVAAEAAADATSIAAQTSTAQEARAALLLAVPLIVGDYSDGAAAVALDWYEELREAAEVRRPFKPQPFRLVTDEYVRNVVAASTKALAEPDEKFSMDDIGITLELVDGSIQELVAGAFRDTITRNVAADPQAAGWRRFARPGACQFCRMLADKGAVFTEKTARFAAHGAVMGGNRKGGNCMCIAGPEFGDPSTWTEASAMQYVASKRQRDAVDRANLRAYLNENFPESKSSSDTKGGARKPKTRKPETPGSGFDALTVAQIESQLAILATLPESDYKKKQGARLRKRLAELR